ncbi:MAG: hypothetical protein H6Q73_2253 [Firmicutes bacterium]|nr:hypothetical protein [Bacillota bacterium]
MVLLCIDEFQNKLKSTSLGKSMVIAYLEKDIAAPKSKNPDDLKKTIQTYIEKVVIFEEHVETHLVLFVHTIGGGEPTPPTRKTFAIRNYLLSESMEQGERHRKLYLKLVTICFS